MNPPGAAAALALLLGSLLALPSALARPPYRQQSITQLHLEGPAWSRKTMDCTYCHVRTGGGAPWNPFGEALKAGFRADPRVDFPRVLHAVLARNADADGDGYPDALEVFAQTLPGDPQSRPHESPEALRDRFEGAGGAARFAPRR